jgi:hypothetical protein
MDGGAEVPPPKAGSYTWTAELHEVPPKDDPDVETHGPDFSPPRRLD